MGRAIAALATLAGVSASADTRADPQASLGVTPGGAWLGAGGSHPSGAFALGGRADVLLLASGPGQMALGPYIDGSTLGFRNANLGGGLTWSVPVTADFSVLVSPGTFLRTGASVEPGLEGALFFGSRSYNFHSWYGLAVGLFAQTFWLPSASSVDGVFGAQIDAEVIALPFILAYDVLTH